MGLIKGGILLIILGLVLALVGAFGIGGLLADIGWILLVVGLVLAVVHAITTRSTH